MYYESPIENLKVVGEDAKGKTPSDSNKCVTSAPPKLDKSIVIYEDRRGSIRNTYKALGRGLQAFGGKECLGRGRGEFVRGRGRFDRGQGGFIRGRGNGGFIRGRGKFERGRGGFIRGRGSFERECWGFVRGRGRWNGDTCDMTVPGRSGPEDSVASAVNEQRGKFDINEDRLRSDRYTHGRGRGYPILGRGRGFARAHTVCIGNRDGDRIHTKSLKGLTEIVQKVPILALDKKLEGKLEEFCRWSLQELFVYLKCLYGIVDEKTMDAVSWSELDRSLIGKAKNDILAKKTIWKKLKQCLPPPTLKESLTYCKKYALRDNIPKCNHPQWPATPETLQSLVEEEVKSVLGECVVPGEKLIEELGTAGMMVICCKLQDKLQKYFLSVADFLKKYPDNPALRHRIVYKRKNVML